ncbi:MAG: hypothetical protein JWM35_1437 [Verrucomicrobia bacterium]|nr:hypothetical protein [Verrucomicrobiota bacterium]
METDRPSTALKPHFRLAALRRFTSPSAPRVVPPEIESCELCSVTLPPRHRHLLETEKRTLVCACDACALRFEGVIGGRFALIPRDARRLSAFQLTDEQWTDLALPIDLAFVFQSTAAGRVVALYPGPAGAVESLLTFATWTDLVAANPVLAALQPDVEALLINRRGATRAYYFAPIDLCYELVGLMRRRWVGLSGGPEVWRDIDEFFARLATTREQEPAGQTEAAHA